MRGARKRGLRRARRGRGGGAAHDVAVDRERLDDGRAECVEEQLGEHVQRLHDRPVPDDVRLERVRDVRVQAIDTLTGRQC